MNTTTMAKMHLDLLAVTAERDHWKTNHDNRVRAAKLLTERTDMPMERIGAYKQYTAALESNQKLRERAESAESELLAVREDNHSMMLEIHNLRIERDALAAELAKLREQEPIKYLYRVIDCFGHDVLRDDPRDATIIETIPLYAAPIPTLAVPAVSGEWVEAGGCAPAIFVPDDDTRRNDEAFAAQQAAPAPSVPDDLAATIRRKFTSGNSVQVESIRISRDEARALLQSANHSEHVLEKVAPDCRTCANRGRVNGLSQESYCDSCIYQGRDWRENHFVDASKTADAVKRRCEACAILPCSCK